MAVTYERQVLAVTDDELATWTASPEGTDPEQARGPCPRCHHPTTATFQSPAVIVAAFINEAVKNVTSLTHLIDCSCQEPHAGRPAGILQGCGGEWLISITNERAGLKVGAGDIALLGAARAFNEASANELSVVRGLAKNWVQGVAALLGLFSLAGLVFTATAVGNLSSGYQIGFAALAATALAAAALGTYMAYRAAFGWPKASRVDNDVKLQEFFSDNGKRAAKAAEYMKYGVSATFLSIAALGAAILILWFGTPASPPSPLVTITSTDGSEPCGNLLPAGSDGSARILTAQGGVVAIAPSTVMTITTVDKCPS
jgi:hypothetical protein